MFILKTIFSPGSKGREKSNKPSFSQLELQSKAKMSGFLDALDKSSIVMNYFSQIEEAFVILASSIRLSILEASKERLSGKRKVLLRSDMCCHS